MADTASRIFGPALLGNSTAVLFTATAPTVVKRLHFCNTTASEVTVTVGVFASAAVTEAASGRVLSGVPVTGNDVLDFETWLPLATGEVIRGHASATSSITAFGAGVVTT